MEKNGEKKEGKKGDEKGQEIEKEVQEKKEIDEAIKGLKGELKNIAIEVHTLFKVRKIKELFYSADYSNVSKSQYRLYIMRVKAMGLTASYI